MLTNRIISEQGLDQHEALAAVGLARSSYHYRSKPARLEPTFDAGLCEAILDINRRAPVYGYRKVTVALRAQGWLVNRKRILRYLRHLKLLQPRKVKGRRFTRPALVHPVMSNTYWEMDLSSVWCGHETGYLFAIIDGYDRGIPGDRFGDRCRAQEAVEALEDGVLRRFGQRVPDGHRLVVRVDRGTQFTSLRFREAAARLGVEVEYAGIQCPDDKPYIESFFGKYKVEEVYRKEYRTLTEARVGWELYRAWHENERVHQSLNYQTPMQVLRKTQETALANEAKGCNIYQASFCPE